ncbi:MAG: SGNH/GDSL hydrolase family protein [Gammaproteobacteria bacterium]|nr:SGNH/GDSL hydrolase family protein [Gammaproteobacteria bacterium]
MSTPLPARFLRAVAAVAWSLPACHCAHAASGLPTAGLPLSRALPVQAASGDAAAAVRPGAVWRSRGVPAALSFDLAPLRQRGIHRLLLLWYNDATYSYDHRLIGQVGYNNLGAYTIEVSATGAGTADWTPVVRVDDNTRHSRSHLIDVTGAARLRINVTRSDGSPGNADAMVHVDIYDASAGVTDGWLFLGDSITANALDHAQVAGVASFPAELEARVGVFPAQENAGIPNWTLADASAHLPAWLDDFPGRFVPLAFGTNDAAQDVAPGRFRSELESALRLVIAKGKVPIVPSIPWSRDPYHASRIPALNEAIGKATARVAGARRGPDLYAMFKAHPDLISDDGVHPTAEGNAMLRKAWVEWAAGQIYRPESSRAIHD